MAVSEDLQTIPARHGTATFVPKGSTIKIVNSSGTQVIDTWAFALPNPPQKGEQQDEKKKKAENGDKSEKLDKAEEEKAKLRAEEEETKGKEQPEEANKKAVAKKGRKSRGGLDLPSQEDAEKATSQQQQQEQKAAEEAQKAQQSTPTKGGWTSYLPSLRGRKQVTDGAAAATAKEEPKKEGLSNKQQQKENSRTWGGYFAQGQAVTSYLPSKGAISAFAAQHARDPAKSYAEQLADFSKTPVGAASLSAITGSGTASSLYAGYSAWNTMHGDTANIEYLSMPHTRAATCHMVPRVNDVLVSNLREPMMTMVEDKSPGVHDTLMAACDPQRYRGLNVEDWEQHGSCAENLVLALKELNDRAGLKGPKGVGASVTVNSVPAPFNLFMNVPWKGDKGDLSFDAPKCKEGDYVRFKAERDIVVVMSACPQDVLDINNKEPKDGHFIVEQADSESSEDEGSSEAKKPPEPKKKERGTPRKLNSSKKTDEKPEEQKVAEKVPLPSTPAVEKSESASTANSSSGAAAPRPKGKPKKLVDPSTGEKKKPRKLEKRAPGAAAAASTPDSGSSATPKDKESDSVAGGAEKQGKEKNGS